MSNTIKIITEEQYRVFREQTDLEVSKIPFRHNRKRMIKDFNYMLTLINSEKLDCLKQVEYGKRYKILTYCTVNLGNTHYPCYVKQMGVLMGVVITGETPCFYKTKTGKISKNKLLAVIV